MPKGGMVGRVYRWRDAYWRVVCRWRSPAPGDVQTWVAACCGHMVLDPLSDPDETVGDDTYCGGCGEMYVREHPRPAGHRQVTGVVRNVLLEKLVPWIEMVPHGTTGTLYQDKLYSVLGEFELVPCGANALVPNGERTVRPFRGLRKP